MNLASLDGIVYLTDESDSLDKGEIRPRMWQRGRCMITKNTNRKNSGKRKMVGSQASLRRVAKEIEVDREFKAHIYQQLVELQPMLSGNSEISVQVQIEKDEKTGALIYEMKLVANIDEGRIESSGRAGDIYSSLSTAKQNMMGQLKGIYNIILDTSEREEEIQGILEGKRNLH